MKNCVSLHMLQFKFAKNVVGDCRLSMRPDNLKMNMWGGGVLTPKKLKKKPKKTKNPKNQFPISNVGQSQKNQKKNQKTQKKTVSNFEFWPKPSQKNQKYQKKPKKKQQKTNANLEISKKTKKKPMPIYRFW